MTKKLESTTAIHKNDITSQKYLGSIEIDGEAHVVKIKTKHGSFLVAGGACNVGLLPAYAREIDLDYETTDEALQELVADLESLPYPSGGLLSWHGSLVI